MNLQTKRLDSANAVVSGVISQDVLEQKTQDVIKKIAKSVKIDGFRKGKVPAHLIQSRYKDQIDKDSKQEAVQDLLQAGLKDLGIEPQAMLGNPLISKFEHFCLSVFSGCLFAAKQGVFHAIILNKTVRILVFICKIQGQECIY